MGYRRHRCVPSKRITKVKICVIIVSCFLMTILLNSCDSTSAEEGCSNRGITLDRLPVIVTAAAADHFTESLGLIESIQTILDPMYGKFKIVFFDIGLQPSQRVLMQNRCNDCDVIPFPFSEYPSHVMDLRNYIWKPLIIDLILQNQDFVMWLDSTIRFAEDKPLDNLFCRSYKSDVLVLAEEESSLEKFSRKVSNFFHSKNYFSLISDINLKWILIRKTNFSVNQFVFPWRLCALRCQGRQYGASNVCPFLGDRKHPRDSKNCHNFQMSVLDHILDHHFGNCNHYKFYLKSFGNIETVESIYKSRPLR